MMSQIHSALAARTTSSTIRHHDAGFHHHVCDWHIEMTYYLLAEPGIAMAFLAVPTAVDFRISFLIGREKWNKA